MDLSELILKIRKEFNLSQDILARRLYRDQRTISAYERGKITPPIDFLTQVSQEFDLEISIKNNEFTLKRRLSMREQIYNFIVNNTITNDYLLEELLSYEELIDKYGRQLPNNLSELLSTAHIESKNIVGVLCKDNRDEIGIFYFGKYKSRILFWHPLYTNVELPDDFKIETPDDKELEGEESKSKYTFLKNELWIALLQRDIDNVTDEELIQALYSTIHSLIVTKDSRINNLMELDTKELKSYINDISLSSETVKTLAIVYSDIFDKDKYLVTFELFHKKHFSGCSKYHEVIDIPSNEILACTQYNLSGEDLIVLHSEYYEKIKKEIVDRMLNIKKH